MDEYRKRSRGRKSARDDVEMIGHRAVRNYFKLTNRRGSQELLHDNVNNGIVDEHGTPLVRGKRQ